MDIPASTAVPKVFISYSWTSTEYKLKILNYAKRLMSDGVDVVLDVWDLKQGHDKFYFMESMVNDVTINKVLIFCDKKYSEKANERDGGVGAEAVITSLHVYKNVRQEKFIPIVMERDQNGKEYLPAYLSTIMYFDLSEDQAENYQQLLRFIHEAPLFEKPKLGEMPAFIHAEPREENNIDKATRVVKLRNKTDGEISPAIHEVQLRAMELVLSPHKGQPFDQAIKALTIEKPLRDELFQLVSALYDSDIEKYAVNEIVSRLFEIVVGGDDGFPQNGIAIWPHGNGICKFLARNLCVSLVARFLSSQSYKNLSEFLSLEFTVDKNMPREASFFEFSAPHSFVDDVVNEQLKQNKVSYGTELYLHEPHGIITKEEIIEADLLIFAKSIITYTKFETVWIPMTTLYTARGSTAARFFARAKTENGGSIFKMILKISFEEFKVKVEEFFAANPRGVFRGPYHPPDLRRLIGCQKDN